jgi:Bacterial dipeptidyl-peptidase Sh3 domain
VIASHYAEPLAKRVGGAAKLRSRPSDGADPIRELEPAEPFLLLDDTLGWAWGYAGKERRVGYVTSDALVA